MDTCNCGFAILYYVIYKLNVGVLYQVAVHVIE